MKNKKPCQRYAGGMCNFIGFCFILSVGKRWRGWLINKMLLKSYLALLFCVAPLFAQQGERIILDYADEFIGKQINGEDVRQLNGHVHLSQGNVQVWCDN
ncbi:MAG: hypothetical protein KGJ59_15345, partial [Bacteroidota bacterium]|nr:hypothetical protein [Bacteroidota bacterium]